MAFDLGKPSNQIWKRISLIFFLQTATGWDEERWWNIGGRRHSSWRRWNLHLLSPSCRISIFFVSSLSSYFESNGEALACLGRSPIWRWGDLALMRACWCYWKLEERRVSFWGDLAMLPVVVTGERTTIEGQRAAEQQSKDRERRHLLRGRWRVAAFAQIQICEKALSCVSSFPPAKPNSKL